MIKSVLTKSNWIVLNKDFAKEYGLNEAILISELAWRQEYYQNLGKLEDGFFFAEAKDIQKATTINYQAQKKAQKKLIEIGVLEVRKRRCTPPRLEYKINVIILDKLVINLYR